MKAFASWSGGKDCTFAVYKFLQNKENEIACLVNMCDDDGEYSRSHGLKKEIIGAQGVQMNMKIIQRSTDRKSYEEGLKKVIAELKEQGVTAGVFGDIYLQAHRDWIERVCADMDIEPVFPLWHMDTKQLLQDFIHTGFKTITVAIDNTKLSEHWLGRVIDSDFLREINELSEIDACAENGEYHSYVFDGPLFKEPVSIQKGLVRTDGKNTYQELLLSKLKNA